MARQNLYAWAVSVDSACTGKFSLTPPIQAWEKYRAQRATEQLPRQDAEIVRRAKKLHTRIMSDEQKRLQAEVALQRAKREAYTKNPETLRWRKRMVEEMAQLGIVGISPYKWAELRRAATRVTDNQSANQSIPGPHFPGPTASAAASRAARVTSGVKNFHG